eukprot:TRINITY_DN6385_c0_g1_i1.p1 TRINITY_DN6385_c0_g1~~TRINITY_DN6385_c0_g1_i1.p1  ORF type:complete len:192 (-),score=31.29 TRINITY_DN6385_c0_g1_i1:196-690(-)
MMSAANWTELCNKEFKWNGIDLKANREEREERGEVFASSRRKKRSAKESSRGRGGKSGEPTPCGFDSYIAPPPQQFVPVIDGSVAPKPSRVPREFPSNYVFAMAPLGSPFMIWPSDMSLARKKGSTGSASTGALADSAGSERKLPSVARSSRGSSASASRLRSS